MLPVRELSERKGFKIFACNGIQFQAFAQFGLQIVFQILQRVGRNVDGIVRKNPDLISSSPLQQQLWFWYRRPRRSSDCLHPVPQLRLRKNGE